LERNFQQQKLSLPLQTNERMKAFLHYTCRTAFLRYPFAMCWQKAKSLYLENLCGFSLESFSLCALAIVQDIKTLEVAYKQQQLKRVEGEGRKRSITAQSFVDCRHEQVAH